MMKMAPLKKIRKRRKRRPKRKKKRCLRKNLILKRGTTSSNSFISLWKTEVLQSTNHLFWAIKISISSNSLDWFIIRVDVTILIVVLYGSKFIWTLAFLF
uniref:AT-rich interaction domain 4A n=1 Tax=Myotis myotis TaxID=51298 RepID=A0A7J8AI31_MYOMY|nr:AT-rich interaction domain 4A [Myotis myotis]